MFSLVMYAFFFLIVLTFIGLGLIISLAGRKLTKTQKPPEDPNIIDVKAIDAVEKDEPPSDPLLHE